MYESFFGLRERPFDLAPNPKFLYQGGASREALSTLRYGLTSPRGLTLLLGEAGSGKTTLVRTVLGELPKGQVQCVLLSNPTLTRSEFLEALAAGFGFEPEIAASKTRFLERIRHHLEARHARGQLTALLLDEAQSLPYELLEEIRLLSNIETTVKLLNVVLAGQPELGERLNEARLRQLKQRISLRCELRPFDGAETAAYIAGRVRIAGGSPLGTFTREAVQAIHDVSGGLPRVINVVCDNALITAFAAGEKPVTRATIDEVVRDLDLAAPSVAVTAAPEPELEPAPVPAPEPVAAVADSSPSSPLFGFFGRRKRFSFF